jgi:hypothetical protein
MQARGLLEPQDAVVERIGRSDVEVRRFELLVAAASIATTSYKRLTLASSLGKPG